MTEFMGVYGLKGMSGMLIRMECKACGRWLIGMARKAWGHADSSEWNARYVENAWFNAIFLTILDGNGTQGMRRGWRQERRFRLWSMNTEEIEYILNRHLKDFNRVFSSNTLPQSPRLLVCYSDPAHKTHDNGCAYTLRTVLENILTHLDVVLM